MAPIQGRPQFSLPRHFQWIDATRGVAAIVVVIFHYHHFYLRNADDRPNIPPTTDFPYARLFDYVFLYGHNAVQLFWVISGFVFAHVYMQRATTIRAFAAARISRLYPLHLATLLIVAGLQAYSLGVLGYWQIYANNDLHHFMLQLALASNSVTQSRGLSFNGPIWSVSLEFPVYLIFLCLLPLLRKTGLLLAVAAIPVFYIAGQTLRLPLLAPAIFNCAAYFFLGCALWFILRRNLERPALLALTGLAALPLALVLPTFDLKRLVICGGLVLMIGALDVIHPHVLRLLRWLGDMSYCIYLIHVPLQILVLIIADQIAPGDRSFAQSYVTLPLFLITTLGLAHVVHHRFELPLTRALRRRLDPHPA